MSDSLRPHRLQHARPPCPSPTPRVYSNWNAKKRKSRDTWSNRQVWTCSKKLITVKANKVLPRGHTGHSKRPLPTQEMTLHMDITRWLIPKSDWLYSLQPKIEKLYTVSKNKTRSWLWLRSWTPHSAFFIVQLSHPYMTTVCDQGSPQMVIFNI